MNYLEKIWLIFTLTTQMTLIRHEIYRDNHGKYKRGFPWLVVIAGSFFMWKFLNAGQQ